MNGGENENSPFAASTKITRSPIKPKINYRQPTEYPIDRTRSQTKPNTPNTDVTTPTETTKQKSKFIFTNLRNKETTRGDEQQTPEGRTNQTESNITTLNTTKQTENADKNQEQKATTVNSEEKEGNQAPKEENTQNITEINIINKITQAKMNQKEIQKSITSFVPEFSGENAHTRANELTRFIGTANSIYESLTNEEERKIFSKLIQYRLTGDAYIRIINRQIKDYKTLRETLESMYKKTKSLDELEMEFNNTQQTYGETIRNFGYRLMEGLEKYKSGFITKYNINEMDQTYTTHLNETAVKIFKKGLNNTILREKMTTCKAKNVDEMIKETEMTEKMLTYITQSTPQQAQTHQETLKFEPQKPMRRPQTQLLCNYCQKPNHTWNICRTRIFNEATAQRNAPYSMNTPYNTNRYTQNNQQFTDRTRNNYNPTQNKMNQQQNYTQMNQTNNINREIPQQNRFNNPFPRQIQQFQPKYCSYCKVTKGHTFEECRNKFLGTRTYNNMNTDNYIQQRNPNTRNYTENNSKPPDENLEDRFNKMRINVINPHQAQLEQEEPHNSENSNGSSHL